MRGGEDAEIEKDHASQLKAQQVTLLRHKAALSSAVEELGTLRAVVAALEATVKRQQDEQSDLLRELQKAKVTEQQLLEQVSDLSSACDRLTETVQRTSVEGAHRVAQLESQRREQEARLRLDIERLQVQLLRSQQVNNSRHIPWNRVAAADGHPAQVLRDVILADQMREQRIRKTMLIDPSSDVRTVESVIEDNLGLLLTARGPAATLAAENEDTRLWLLALRRVHDALADRRRTLHVGSDHPDEYLLRTRHEMVSQIVQLHTEVRRLSGIVAELYQVVYSSSSKRGVGSSNTTLIEGHVELVAATLSDIDFAFSHLEQLCFTDVDRAFHRLAPAASS